MPRQHRPARKTLRVAQVLTSGIISILIAGCGQTGTPLAPSLWLPTPVADLTVSRVADHVTLKWTTPRRTTDKLLLKGPQSVRVCRREGHGPCLTVGNVSFPPDKTANYDDVLPSDLIAGPPKVLEYSVEVLNPHGHSAGASNIAYAAAGSSPPPFVRPRGEASANGVILEWQPAPLTGSKHKIEIQRTLLSTPTASSPESKPKSALGVSTSTLVKERTLVVRLPPEDDTGRALDPDAALDQRYCYRISRVVTVVVAGESLDIEGPLSPEILVDTKDIFPPAAPTGLAAVGAPDEGAIDLSWSPNTENDLAGYAVYRSEASGEAMRISPPAKPLEIPAFRDLTAKPGRDYSYSVTAIDRDGNQSARSADVKESLPTKP
jgi:hypothetical protein